MHSSAEWTQIATIPYVSDRREASRVPVQVTVDPELCIGSGDCQRLAPSAFRVNDDTTVSEPLPGAASTDVDLLLRAATNCPTQAIRIVAEDGTVLHESN
jgi:ferredoxin